MWNYASCNVESLALRFSEIRGREGKLPISQQDETKSGIPRRRACAGGYIVRLKGQ